MSSSSERPAERASRDQADQPARDQAVRSSHGKILRPRRLPVSEFAFSLAGAASPFGDELRFPLPIDQLTYNHPEPAQGQMSDRSHH